METLQVEKDFWRVWNIVSSMTLVPDIHICAFSHELLPGTDRLSMEFPWYGKFNVAQLLSVYILTLTSASGCVFPFFLLMKVSHLGWSLWMIAQHHSGADLGRCSGFISFRVTLSSSIASQYRVTSSTASLLECKFSENTRCLLHSSALST